MIEEEDQLMMSEARSSILSSTENLVASAITPIRRNQNGPTFLLDTFNLSNLQGRNPISEMDA